MDCPKCGSKTTVLDTRYNEKALQKKRRRICTSKICGNRFTTVEKVAISSDDLPRVVKKDNRREKFSEKKLVASLKLALVKRPVSNDATDTIINKLQQKLLVSTENEINAKEIGLFIMHELKNLDQVAYIRFASVYRDFKDTGAFKSEIDKMSEPGSVKPRPNQLKLFRES